MTDTPNPPDEYFEKLYTAMGHRLVRAGWLSFFWMNPFDCHLTETGKKNLSQLYELLKLNNTEILPALDLSKVSFMSEIKIEELKREDLQILGALVIALGQSGALSISVGGQGQ